MRPNLFALLIMLTFAAQSQPLDLEQILTLLEQQNLTLKSQELDFQQAKASYDNSWNILLPSIKPSAKLSTDDRLFADASAYKIPGTQGLQDSDSNSLTLNFGLQLNLAWGQIIPVLESLRLQKESQQLQYQHLKRQLRRDLTKLFYQLLASRDNLQLLTTSIDYAQQGYQTAQQRYENGLITKVELLQAQVNYENSKPAHRQANLLFHQNLNLLLRLIGLEQKSEDVELVGQLTDELEWRPPADLAPLLGQMQSGRLDLQNQQLQQQIAYQGYRQQLLGALIPDLGLGLAWSTLVTSPFEDGTSSWDKDVFTDRIDASISLNWELAALIPGSQASVSRENNLRQQQQLKLQQQQLWQDSQGRIFEFIFALNNYQQEKELNQLGLELAQQSFDLNQQSYQQGLRTSLDLDNARLQLLRAQQNLLTSRKNLLVTEQDLLFEVGLEHRRQLLELYQRN